MNQFYSNEINRIQILFSFLQFLTIISLLILQIFFNQTKTCFYQIGLIYWISPFLFCSPISIFFYLYRTNLFIYYWIIRIHFCSSLLTSFQIFLSIFILFRPDLFFCSIDSINNYFIGLNCSIIGLSFLLKFIIYSEILLLYFTLKIIDEKQMKNLIFIQKPNQLKKSVHFNCDQIYYYSQPSTNSIHLNINQNFFHY